MSIFVKERQPAMKDSISVKNTAGMTRAWGVEKIGGLSHHCLYQINGDVSAKAPFPWYIPTALRALASQRPTVPDWANSKAWGQSPVAVRFA
jgi:hypothetical protein